MIVVLDTNVFVAALVAKGLCHEVVVRGLGAPGLSLLGLGRPGQSLRRHPNSAAGPVCREARVTQPVTGRS
jgi:hypothetical protein